MSGFDTAQASSRQGMTSSVAEIIVQFRPPKTGTANVYGSRRKAPTPLGTATSHSAWVAVSANPDAAGLPSAPAVICTTTMLHSSHTENPMCSAKIDQIRLRLAVGLPTVPQNSGSSGRQSSIQSAPLVEGGADRVDTSASVTVTSESPVAIAVQRNAGLSCLMRLEARNGVLRHRLTAVKRRERCAHRVRNVFVRWEKQNRNKRSSGATH